MHFEVLAEDKSGTITLEKMFGSFFTPKDNLHTWNIHQHSGIGHLPKNLMPGSNPKTQMLLNKLPSMLKAYGKTFRGYGANYSAAVIVVCDLDNRNYQSFMTELTTLIKSCDPAPTTAFVLAVEEGEAWLLGDREAVTTAYPGAKLPILDAYVPDNVCGTWEVLADAIYPGGAAALKKVGYPEIGRVKCAWADKIAPHMDLNANRSPSFQKLIEVLTNLTVA